MKLRYLIFFGGAMVTSTALGFDCNSDCSEVGGYHYPCPNFRNPGKVCEGNDPVQQGLCQSQKEASCVAWQAAVRAFEPSVRPLLEQDFNARTYAAATGDSERQEYLLKCEAAGVAAAAASGSVVGGPYGAGLSGAIGTFVAYEICKQSTAW